jgi:hypothetical protein
MGRRTPTPQESAGRDQPVDPGLGPQPHPGPPTPPGETLSIGPILVQTVRHFFPELNFWIDAIDDPRFLPFITYSQRFLLWWGLSLFLFKLGSRRQLDYQLNSDGPEVLANLNRLAGTQQQSRPVNKTLNCFLGQIGSAAVAKLRTQLVRRLIRMKVLDAARLQGRFVVATDATGYLLFRYQHCDHCLTQRHGDTTLYLHQALEAKLLGPAETVISLGTAFIDNRDVADTPADASSEQRKQDCELKAQRRLAKRLREEFPQLPLCLSGDGLHACGEGFQIAKDYHLDFVYGFQPGRFPALWADFQGLLPLCPKQRVEVWTPQQVHQVYRWVNDLSDTDSQGRPWTLHAIQCEETPREGEKSVWSWLTQLEVNHQTVVEVATKGGRHRWHIENQGFNTQKNSGLNLEHAYSHGSQWAAYYYLLQIAHLLLQLVEKGSLLRQLATRLGKRTALELYGSLKNMAQRLLESVRYRHWPDEVFQVVGRPTIQIRLDSS